MSIEQDGDPLYINSKAMLANKTGLEAVGLAMDLVTVAWWPTKAPFHWDEEALFELLNTALPARGYTVEKLRSNKSQAQSYFTVLDDDRWVPSPEYFSMTNGNPGSQS